jgi:hypothetical protein
MAELSITYGVCHMEFRYAECRYAECRGAPSTVENKAFVTQDMDQPLHLARSPGC